MTMAARGGGAAAESDHGNDNKWGRSDDDDEYDSNDAEATAFARRQHPVARRPPRSSRRNLVDVPGYPARPRQCADAADWSNKQ